MRASPRKTYHNCSRSHLVDRERLPLDTAEVPMSVLFAVQLQGRL
jgi:hypothetical protein